MFFLEEVKAHPNNNNFKKVLAHVINGHLYIDNICTALWTVNEVRIQVFSVKWHSIAELVFPDVSKTQWYSSKHIK